MLTLQDVLEVLSKNDGKYTFGADKLNMQVVDFQTVVKLIRDAEARGLVTIYREHPSGRSVGMDSVVVEGPTALGLEYLNRE